MYPICLIQTIYLAISTDVRLKRVKSQEKEQAIEPDLTSKRGSMTDARSITRQMKADARLQVGTVAVRQYGVFSDMFYCTLLLCACYFMHNLYHRWHTH